MRKSHLFALALITLAAVHSPAEEVAYQPQIFQSLKLVYEDQFDGGTINADFWEVRQNTTWVIRDGVMHGDQSTKEFQAKKVAEGDKAHAGFKPVIWLKKVPENFVCAMRVRYDAKAFQKGFPLLDHGHHIQTINFAENAKTTTKKTEVEKMNLDKQIIHKNSLL